MKAAHDRPSVPPPPDLAHERKATALKIVRELVTAWIGFWWLFMTPFALMVSEVCIGSVDRSDRGACEGFFGWGLTSVFILEPIVLFLTRRAFRRATSDQHRWFVLAGGALISPALLIGLFSLGDRFYSADTQSVTSDSGRPPPELIPSEGLLIEIDPVRISQVSVELPFGNMIPGTFAVGREGFTITNAGTRDLRYAIMSTTTGSPALAAELDLTIWVEGAESDEDATCESGAPATVLYGPGDLGSPAGANLVGDPTPGSQAGDRVLAPAAREILCLRVSLPIGADSSYQELSTAATIEFVAEEPDRA